MIRPLLAATLLLPLLANAHDGTARAAPTPAATPAAEAPPAPRRAPGMPPADAKLATVAVAPGLWMIAGPGGNVLVSAGPDGTFLVDDQWSSLAPRLDAAVRELGAKPARFVINTHWHMDHTGGNELFGGQGAVVVAHANVRRRMSARQFIAAFGIDVPPSPPGALPVVTFDDAVTLHLNGDDVRVFHVPGAHTDGDAFVHFAKADVIHLGDVYFNGTYPFVDVSSGGSHRGLIAAVDRALAVAGPATRIVPGHGPLAGRADLAEYRRMLATVVDRVAALVAERRSLDEVIAARPTAEFDATWGGGLFPPERWLAMLYADLARPAAAGGATR